MALLHLTLLLCVLHTGFSASLFKHRHYYHDGLCEKVTDCKAGFSYDRDNGCKGPKWWYTISDCYTDCSSTKRQSPINIITKNTKYNRNLPTLRFEEKNEDIETTVHNNQNHAPEFEAEDELLVKMQQLTKGGYSLRNLHIHRGRSIHKGSEHAVNGRHTPMEAHLVFKNDTSDPQEEIKVLLSNNHYRGHSYKTENNILVIGVFLEVASKGFGKAPSEEECENILEGKCKNGHNRNNGECEEEEDDTTSSDDDDDDDNDDDDDDECDDDIDDSDSDCDEDYNDFKSKKHIRPKRCCVRKARKISRILECAYRHPYVRKFQGHQDESTYKKLHVEMRPEDILPRMCYRQYYAYEGSLTTPPCSETVQWIVMRCHVKVSKRVLHALGDVEGYPDGKTLSYYGIRRPIQHNDEMTVYRNF